VVCSSWTRGTNDLDGRSEELACLLVKESKLINRKVNSLIIGLLSIGCLSACATYKYEPTADSAKFYEDKLGCETKYTAGYDMFSNRIYGDIYKEGPARDCLLAKGYKTAL